MISVREFFKQGRSLQIEIDELQKARKKAFELACSTSEKFSDERLQSVETRYANYAEYSSMIEERIEMLSIYRKDMLDIINKIPNTIYRTLLIARYINCESWEKVSESIGYESVKWVRTSLHDKAIVAAEKNKNTTLNYPMHM
jgi:hypothetical protein